MKAFFGKIWAWIVAHKVISIVIAAALVVGTTSAIVLPIALHNHSFATEWSSDADNHWHDATCKHGEEKDGVAAHTYDNACDTKCNVCDYERTVGAHEYDNACDTDCNICGATRGVEPHVYDNACDTDCNICGATRSITHDHADTLTVGETTHYYLCSVCGDKKDETAHTFDKTVAHSDYLKAEATATTKAQYWKSCECGAASTTEYFETDKTAATLTDIQDLSKTYDKVELQDPTYVTNSDGAVTIEWYQGDTKLDAKPVNAGTYKVKVIVAESATYAGVSGEKEFTIAKKVLSGLSFEFVYRGEANFDTDYLTEAQGILAADVADGIFIFVQFDSKNVGATVTDIEIDYGENSDSFENYEIDMATFTANIVKRVIWAENVVFTYNGENEFYGDEAVADVKFENAVSGEINPADIVFEFSGSGVGNTLTNVKFDDGIPYAQNYTFDLSKCTASIVKRVIWTTGAEFVYDGYDHWTGEESPKYENIVFHNVAVGDTIAADFVEWTFDGVSTTSALVSVSFIDLDDGRSNYEIDLSKCSASIVKRSVWVENVEFVYWGFDNFYGDQATAAVTFENLVSGDVVDAGDVWFKFNAADAGSGLAGVYFDGAGNDITDNYEFDLSKCSASILPKDIDVSGVVLEDVYKALPKSSLTYNFTAADGVVSGETLNITVVTESGNVGAKGESFSWGASKSASNYTFGGKTAAEYGEIAKGLVNIEKAHIKFTLEVQDKEYNGQTVFPEIVGLPAWFDISVADIDVDYKPADAGEDHYGMNNNPVTPGTYTVRVGINETENYESYVSRAEFTISKKALTLDITHVYDGGVPIPKLTAENGVVAGDDVNIILEYWQSYDNAGTYKFTDKLDAKPDGEHNLEGVYLFGEDKDNYTFTYDAEGYVGSMTLAPFVLDIPARLNIEADADGTNYITFVVNASDGYSLNRDVTVRIPIYFVIDSTPVTQYGVYSTTSGDPENEVYFGTPEYYVMGIGTLRQVDTFVLPEDFDANYPADITVYDARNLYVALQYTTGQEIDADTVAYIGMLLQGTLKKGDKIKIYAGGALFDTAYTVDKIEVDGVEVEFALPGDVVTIYSADIPVNVPAQTIFTDESGDIKATETRTLFVKVKMNDGKQLTNNNGYFKLAESRAAYFGYAPTFSIIGADKIEAGGEGYLCIYMGSPIVT